MSAEPFLRVIDLLPEPILVLSADGTILGASRRIARLGIDPASLRGRRLPEVTVEPADVVGDYLRRCARTAEQVPGSLTLRGADGRGLPCWCNGSVLEPSAE